MKILLLSWRDVQSKGSGGAEVFTHEMMKRNAKTHEIVHLSPAAKNLANKEIIDGVLYRRKGNWLTVVFHAIKLSRKQKWDIIIDQANTHLFLSPLWKPKNTPIVLFIHQLTREIWLQTFKGFKLPLGVLGYLLEPVFLWIYRNKMVMTVSESTKKGLMKFGHKSENITILPEGLNFKAWKEKDFYKKEKNFTMLYAGRFSRYKGVIDSVLALEMLIKNVPNTKLWIMGKGSDKETKYLKNLIQKKKLEKNVKLLGFVSKEEKLKRMSRSHVLVIPSGREGWGLVVTEANAVGTLAVGYPSPGLTDSIRHNKTGIITQSKTPASLAHTLNMIQKSPKLMRILSKNGHKWAGEFSWNNTGEAFAAFLKHNFVTPEVKPVAPRSRTQQALVPGRQRVHARSVITLPEK